MIEVLEILPGNRAIVSTKGLCRVVIKATGETVAELAEAGVAKNMVDFFGQPEWNEPAESVPYEALHEFLTPESAEDEAARFNRCCSTATAEAVPYDEQHPAPGRQPPFKGTTPDERPFRSAAR